EHGQPPEPGLLARFQEVIAPGDGATERPLPLRPVAGAARQQLQPLAEASQQGWGGSRRMRAAASSSASGSPSRRWQIPAMAAAFAVVSWKSGLAATARSRNRATAANC